ncbi:MULTISPECIES: sulfotransferase [Cycloclasticus]|jgi:hypothetical protein|uniref:Sulfotransferase family protein n=1 Tax=Cycloclasticus pugetii TaxID=34068 RepID=A0AB33Z0Z7_9GAMM|nr:MULTISPECIES: sulfotransferase [Cycloclasticus]ATI02653.1 hypothetical protein CPC19_03965 [Cycloclasticus sp. PY97N]EPD12829.1 hypothetical protein L196_08166 [Cycloclasticus pugetii]
MKKKLVFILSSNYSGSHFLSLLLGSHSKAVHLGETKNLIKEGVNCYKCGVSNDCHLFEGIQELTTETFYPTLFDRAGDQINLLIDTSKKTEWAINFINTQSEYDIKIVHLIRDPRALIRRWNNKYTSLLSQLSQRRKVLKAFPKKTLQLIFSSQSNIYLYKWLKQNQKIVDFTKRFSLDTKTITYHDLTLNPEKELSTLMEWLGNTYETTQLKYWEFEHHGTQKRQYEWVKKQQTTSHIDLRWKDALTKKQSKLISSNRDLRSYLEQNKLFQIEKGITKL